MAALELTRVADWQGRLGHFVNRHLVAPEPYRYCGGYFVVQGIEAITGVWILPGLQPTGWLGTARFFIANGWNDVEQMFESVLGPALADTRESIPGDVVSFGLQ